MPHPAGDRPSGAAVQDALAVLAELGDVERAYLQDEMVRRAAALDAQATLAWLDANVTDVDRHQQLMVSAYAGMASRDPQGALMGASALADPQTRRLAQQQGLAVWAADDVVAAYAWASSQPDFDGLAVPVMEEYLTQLPQQAGELVAALPEGAAKTQLVDRYASHLAKDDVGQALTWVAQFDEEPAARPALSTVFDQWARQDPWAAVDHAAARVEGELSFELVAQVANHLAWEDAPAAAGSLERFPEAHRPGAARQVARAWGERDPAAARRWAQSLAADTAVREAAMAELDRTEGPDTRTP